MIIRPKNKLRDSAFPTEPLLFVSTQKILWKFQKGNLKTVSLEKISLKSDNNWGSYSQLNIHFQMPFIDVRNTLQPLYNTIVGVQAKIRVNYSNHVISRVKF